MTHNDVMNHECCVASGLELLLTYQTDKQRNRLHIQNMTLSYQNQLLTKTASKDKAFWTLLRCFMETKHTVFGLGNALTQKLPGCCGLSHLSVPAWLICVIQQSVPLQLLRVVQYGRSDDNIGY